MSHFQRHSIYREYKYIRNLLNKCNLFESLYVIWGFSRNILFNFDFPPNIEKPFSYNPKADRFSKEYNGIIEFEQEYLVKEIIINCCMSGETKSLRKNSYLGKIINHIRSDLTSEVEKFAIKDDFLIELNRLLHKQLKWNRGLEQASLFRNFMVFSNDFINQIFENKYDIDVYDFYFATITLYTLTAMHFRIRVDVIDIFPNKIKNVFKKYLDLFCIDFITLKSKLCDLQEMNENIFYTYNPMLEKPIIRYENDILCPFQLMIYSQGAGGIYYSLFMEKGFDKAIGDSFQIYIGNVLTKANKNNKITIIEEKSYGKPLKHTTDWIIYDQDSIAFIECKCKRLKMASKFSLDIYDGLNDDLDKMAEFITQIYKTYIEYSHNKYPNLPFRNEQFFLPVVVTFESWNIIWNPKIMEMLNDKVKSKFKENGIQNNLLKKHPYHVYSAEELENNIQVINEIGLTDYINKFNSNILNDFKKDFNFKFIFEEEYNETFIKEIAKYQDELQNNLQ